MNDIECVFYIRRMAMLASLIKNKIDNDKKPEDNIASNITVNIPDIKIDFIDCKIPDPEHRHDTSFCHIPG